MLNTCYIFLRGKMMFVVLPVESGYFPFHDVFSNDVHNLQTVNDTIGYTLLLYSRVKHEW